jgi:hypothetical protein
MVSLPSAYVLIGRFSNVEINTVRWGLCLYGRVIYECVDGVFWYSICDWPTVHFCLMLYISSDEKSELVSLLILKIILCNMHIF